MRSSHASLSPAHRAFGRASTTILVVLSSACAPGAADETAGTQTEGSTAAFTGEDAVARASEWVAARLHYCQSPNHERDYDSACSAYCERTDNAIWNPYRSDCSGLVSWSWRLPAPGRVTTEFAPFVDDITHTVEASSLRAGDAVNNSEHVMLFKAWNTQNEVATFIEEPGCSSSTPFAHEFTSRVTVSGTSIHVDYNGMTFTAIRYDHITVAPPPTTEAIPPAPTACGVIDENHGLGPGHSITSCDGRHELIMQSDGNFVLYHDGHATWATATNGRGGYVAVMQGDGNLVVYDRTSAPLWASHTSGHAGAYLAIQNDGNVVVYEGTHALWASGTNGR